jgi:hypothetical protein
MSLDEDSQDGLTMLGEANEEPETDDMPIISAPSEVVPQEDSKGHPDPQLTEGVPKDVETGVLQRQDPKGKWTSLPIDGLFRVRFAKCTRALAAKVYGQGRYRFQWHRNVNNKSKVHGYSKWFTIGPTGSTPGVLSNTPSTEPAVTEPGAYHDFRLPHVGEWPTVPVSGPARDLAGMTAPVLNLMRGIAFLIHESSAPLIAQARTDAEAQLALTRAQHEAALARDRAFYQSVIERDRQWTETLSQRQRNDGQNVAALAQRLDAIQQAEPEETPSNHWDAIAAILEKSPELIDALGKLLRGKPILDPGPEPAE